MFNELKNIIINKQNLKQFGLLFGTIFFCIGIYLLFIQKTQVYPYFIIIGFLLYIIAFTIPTILKFFYFLWMAFSIILGWFMSRLILSLLFYMLFLPIGFFGRIFGYQFIELKWNKDSKSYWNERTEQIENDHENQF